MYEAVRTPPSLAKRGSSRVQNRSTLLLPGLEGLDTNPPANIIIGPSSREYGGTSLCGFSPADWPRRPAIKLVEHRLFEPLILLTILANCVMMAMSSPLDPSGTRKAAIADSIETSSLAIFTVEMALKLLAFGVQPYLADGWCQLDLATVLLSWLPILFPSLGSFNVIRMLRGLRPLRALKRVPGMPALVQAILASLPKVYAVLGLVALLVLLFALVGVELFQGRLHHRCMSEDGADTGIACIAAADAMIATTLGAGAGGANATRAAAAPAAAPAAVPVASAAAAAGGGRRACPAGTHCAFFEPSERDDLTSYDSVAVACISLLRVLTFDACARPVAAGSNRRSQRPCPHLTHRLPSSHDSTGSEMMYLLMDAVSPWIALFFVTLGMTPAIRLGTSEPLLLLMLLLLLLLMLLTPRV